ncbi:hypothetical protein IQ235_07910 [Oscillatoriales cyanobacterium LEGE 11467]|uniref:Uncharacterized protein n=1 Tax=Zarconia navalis LEGE 11467 TaxID=1828826 RepID=A0A928Z8I6_9CYAN|nr:hypothetical protein [Zarconia navalis]MBE9040703.1 hypothetical protein [Zarconia navalis LEGE 11467]
MNNFTPLSVTLPKEPATIHMALVLRQLGDKFATHIEDLDGKARGINDRYLNGHYFDDYEDAVEDWKSRLREKVDGDRYDSIIRELQLDR